VKANPVPYKTPTVLPIVKSNKYHVGDRGNAKIYVKGKILIGICMFHNGHICDTNQNKHNVTILVWQLGECVIIV